MLITKTHPHSPYLLPPYLSNTSIHLTTMRHLFLLTALLVSSSVHGFAPNGGRRSASTALGGLMDGVKDFFAELDAFMDDASARRLGNGAAFYGKRKSNFYGEQDSMKKSNPRQPDPTEDYQGPTTAGYFQWQRDEEGQMRPVTRMKGKVIERNPSFWDRVYEQEEES